MSALEQSRRDTLEMLQRDPGGTAHEAKERFSQTSGVDRCDLMLIAGTGWDLAVAALGRMDFVMPVTDLSGFLPTIADGQPGTIGCLKIGNLEVCVSNGRTHAWEFKGGWIEAMPALLHRIYFARELGCRIIIHTSAVGGLLPSQRVGDLVLVRDFNDQVAFVPSPLLGGPNHLDVTKVYDPGLLDLCRQIEPLLTSAVLATVLGPHYEPPAVARYLAGSGVGIVGMSGIPEAIMAHFLGIRNLTMGIVTDPAGEPVTSDEVQRVVRERGPALGGFLRRVIERMRN